MNKNKNWKTADIAQVYNFLLISGDQVLKSGRGIESVHQACYALPSDPAEMDEWCNQWLDEKGIEKLYLYISS